MGTRAAISPKTSQSVSMVKNGPACRPTYPSLLLVSRSGTSTSLRFGTGRKQWSHSGFGSASSNLVLSVCGTSRGTERGHCGMLLTRDGSVDAQQLRMSRPTWRSHRAPSIRMRVTVSIPDELIDRIMRLARRSGRSRCTVIRAALLEHVSRHASEDVTRAMNRVCNNVGVEPGFLAAVGRRVFEWTEW
jgi:predicted DNA-binding protein